MDWIELHKFFASKNIRIFNITIDHDTITLIHPNKTIENWRKDFKEMIKEIKNDQEGFAADNLQNEIVDRMREELGYIRIEDLVDDVFEGRTATYKAAIIDDPEHEEQEDGFGHYGWVNQTCD